MNNHFFCYTQIFININIDINMAKKIKITQQQLEEAVNTLRLEEASNTDNITVDLEGDGTDIRNRVKQTVDKVRSKGLDPNKVNINVPNEIALKCSKVLTKAQILEARRQYLQENSKQYTKANFLKK